MDISDWAYVLMCNWLIKLAPICSWYDVDNMLLMSIDIAEILCANNPESSTPPLVSLNPPTNWIFSILILPIEDNAFARPPIDVSVSAEIKLSK